MGEKEIKTAEERLQILIEKSEVVLVKLRKTLNGFLIIGIPTIIAFLATIYSNSNRMTAIETTRMTDEVLYEKFATKQRVVFLQNDIYDLNNSTFKQNDWTVSEDIEKEYTKALKTFMGDVSRGGS